MELWMDKMEEKGLRKRAMRPFHYDQLKDHVLQLPFISIHIDHHISNIMRRKQLSTQLIELAQKKTRHRFSKKINHFLCLMMILFSTFKSSNSITGDQAQFSTMFKEDIA
jgi:hypothetical protein